MVGHGGKKEPKTCPVCGRVYYGGCYMAVSDFLYRRFGKSHMELCDSCGMADDFTNGKCWEERDGKIYERRR